jgi:hypothetical protein
MVSRPSLRKHPALKRLESLGNPETPSGPWVARTAEMQLRVVGYLRGVQLQPSHPALLAELASYSGNSRGSWGVTGPCAAPRRKRDPS